MSQFVIVLLIINTAVLSGLLAVGILIWLAIRAGTDEKAAMGRAEVIRREVRDRLMTRS